MRPIRSAKHTLERYLLCHRRILQNNQVDCTTDSILLTGGRVVLQTEVDVLLDTKAEASSVREVFALELILLNLQPSLEDLQCLVSADLHNHTTGTDTWLVVVESTGGIARV